MAEAALKTREGGGIWINVALLSMFTSAALIAVIRLTPAVVSGGQFVAPADAIGDPPDRCRPPGPHVYWRCSRVPADGSCSDRRQLCFFLHVSELNSRTAGVITSSAGATRARSAAVSRACSANPLVALCIRCCEPEGARSGARA